jgi:hypothetical protein
MSEQVQIPQEALEAGWAAILDGVRRKYPGALVELVDREESGSPQPAETGATHGENLGPHPSG